MLLMKLKDLSLLYFNPDLKKKKINFVLVFQIPFSNNYIINNIQV